MALLLPSLPMTFPFASTRVPSCKVTARCSLAVTPAFELELFRSRRANELAGFMCSLATLTPFAYWRRLHARHHASWNNLDGRGIPADFFSDCATLAEYAAMSRLSWASTIST